jgi:hypothetical protein
MKVRGEPRSGKERYLRVAAQASDDIIVLRQLLIRCEVQTANWNGMLLGEGYPRLSCILVRVRIVFQALD